VNLRANDVEYPYGAETSRTSGRLQEIRRKLLMIPMHALAYEFLPVDLEIGIDIKIEIEVHAPGFPAIKLAILAAIGTRKVFFSNDFNIKTIHNASDVKQITAKETNAIREEACCCDSRKSLLDMRPEMNPPIVSTPKTIIDCTA
jgi:hypothetical protein